jgi:spermidine synthase
MADEIMKGWFSDVNEQWPGIAISLKLKEKIYEGRTKFQDIAFYETETFGKIMTLDGALQITERDEFSYQEMISHLPLFSHPCPKRVLVIGGGDGGVLREVAKHDCVEHIDICEIDDGVITMSKQWLPYAAVGYGDPRVTVHVGDGATFARNAAAGSYDVIIVDSSDPEGPARVLFDTPFYSDMHRILTERGVVSSQGECFWLHAQLIKRLIAMSRGIFPTVEYAWASVPTYPAGQIGFMISSKAGSCRKPARPVPAEMLKKLRYYNSEVHEAVFAIPQFAKNTIFGEGA